MPAETPPVPAGMKVMYDIGAAMTREQMEAFENAEREAGRPVGQMPPAKNDVASAEHTPASELLFTDARVGSRRAALASMLSPLLSQKQAGGKTC
eukprot:4893252-Pleurochrysis_carterae.AAC.1